MKVIAPRVTNVGKDQHVIFFGANEARRDHGGPHARQGCVTRAHLENLLIGHDERFDEAFFGTH